MSIYKACDIRGTFGEELRVEHADRLGHALAIYRRPDRILIGGDGRLSTPVLKTALISSLTECGTRVLDVGILPTPIFYYARHKLQIPVGVMVTASHNPAPDNGFKIILGELPIEENDIAAIRDLMESNAPCEAQTRGDTQAVAIIEEYVASMTARTELQGKLRIVVDAGNGMWGPIAPRVFRALGHEVIELFCDVDGRFPNRSPNPAVASNLAALCDKVRECSADLGVAYDGDGDRVAFVDETGEPLDSDRAIVLFARDALQKKPNSSIVYDQKCSDVVREAIEESGGIPHRVKSGHTFIKTTFLETQAAYAGELSGHHFFVEVEGDDALYASLRMAKLLQASKQKLSHLIAPIPRYAITPDIRLHVAPGEGEEIIARIKSRLHDATEMSEADGIRAQFEDSWGLVRASVTEPAITLRFEGRTEEALQRIKNRFIEAAPQLTNRI